MKIVSNQNLYSIIDKLSHEKELGLDTETTGLLEHDRLFSIQISSQWDDYYFNFSTNEDVPTAYQLNKQETLARLQVKVFNNRDLIWYIQNAKFDLGMLQKESCEIYGPVHCTKTGERLLKNNIFGKGSYSLDAMAKRRGLEKDSSVSKYITKHKLYTDVRVKGKSKAFRQLHFDKVPFDIITKYGCQDAYLHRVIGQEQRKTIKKMSFGDIKKVQRVLDNEMELTKVCLAMERSGIKTDRPYITEAINYELSEMDRLKAEFLLLTDKKYKDSNKLFAEVFDEAGLAYPKTEKGNPSFRAEVLDDIENPIADIIKGVRRHEKYAGTYYANFLYLADNQDILRASIDQSGTETGRFSYRDPNLQNVPKEDEGEFEFYVRKSFVPRDGKCFVSLDYKQIEYRVLADLAGERKLIDRINDGEDVHDVTADLCSITRKKAKTVNFAVVYGTGAEKLAKMLGISVREAKELKELYFGRLPRIEDFLRKVAMSAKNRGYVTNWLGRRCYLDDRNYAYKMPNHLVQGSCGDIAKVAMVRIYDNIQRYALINVHDELLFELDDQEFSLIPAIRRIMANSYEPVNGIKIETDIEHSWVSWGYCDMKEGEPSGPKEKT